MVYKNILISNFPSELGFLSPLTNDGKEIPSLRYSFIGYLKKIEYQTALHNSLEKFFTSLLLYNEIYISDKDFIKVIKFIGVEDAIKLLESKCIKLFHTHLEPSVIVHHSVNKLAPTVRYEIEPIAYIPSVIYVEKNFKVFSDNQSLRNRLVQYLEDSYLDINDFDKTLYFNSIQAIEEQDKLNLNNLSFPETFKTLRDFEVELSFRLENKYGNDTTLLDEYGSYYITSKIQALENKALIKSNLFKETLDIKKIPDFFEMYKNGVLEIEDFLAIRESFQTKLFREWFLDPKIQIKNLYSELLKPYEVNSLIEKIRFIVPTIIGMQFTALGVATSYTETFLIPKILNKWHPKLFLDDVLYKKLNDIQNNHLYRKQKEIIDERFVGIDGNELCPCRSKLKYKNCHGIDPNLKKITSKLSM